MNSRSNWTPERGHVAFPMLDSIRAIGALCVLTTHTAFWAGSYTRNGAAGTLLARLDVGVAIFFVLSGFLLSRPFLAHRYGLAPEPAWSSYFRKRFWRIAPLYAVTVVLALVLIESNRDIGARGWLRTLLLLDTATGSGFPAGLTHMWSLAVEVAFYVALPGVILALLGRDRTGTTTRCLLVIAGMFTVTIYWHLDGAGRLGQHVNGAALQWLPAFLSWFALGLLVALVEVRHRTHEGARHPVVVGLTSLAQHPGVAWALVVGLMLCAATPLAGPSLLGIPTPSQSLVKNLLYAAVGMLVVITGVFAVPGSRYQRALSHPVPRRLGIISYGIFCLHLPVLHFVMWSTGWPLFAGRGVWIWLLTLALSVAVAEAAYRAVELPGIRRGHQRRGRRARGSHSSDPSAPATAKSGR